MTSVIGLALPAVCSIDDCAPGASLMRLDALADATQGHCLAGDSN